MARRLDHPAKDRLREGEAASDLVVTADDVLQSKILVVDDDRISCEILLNYLNDRGFQNIGFAFDGEISAPIRSVYVKKRPWSVAWPRAHAYTCIQC